MQDSPNKIQIDKSSPQVKTRNLNLQQQEKKFMENMT